MLGISVRADYLRVARDLDARLARQLPFAGARALTETARAAADAVGGALPEIFDRPTPFTRRAIGIQPATKASLTARVFVKTIQAGYLALEETGGTRTPKGRALVVPVDAALNQYGNMPRGLLQRLKGRGGVFVGTVRGIGGFWQRLPNGHLKLVAAFRPSAEYRPRFFFRRRVLAAARARFLPLMRRSLDQAIRSARE